MEQDHPLHHVKRMQAQNMPSPLPLVSTVQLKDVDSFERATDRSWTVVPKTSLVPTDLWSNRYRQNHTPMQPLKDPGLRIVRQPPLRWNGPKGPQYTQRLRWLSQVRYHHEELGQHSPHLPHNNGYVWWKLNQWQKWRCQVVRLQDLEFLLEMKSWIVLSKNWHGNHENCSNDTTIHHLCSGYISVHMFQVIKIP